MAEYYNSKIQTLIERAKGLKHELIAQLYRSISNHEEEIILMVTVDQLYNQGINGDGVDIFSYKPYTVNTRYMKALANQPTDRVTLRDTGEFHSTFFVVLTDDGFFLNATDSKTDALIKKYGEEIFGLTKENVSKLIEDYLRPEITEKIVNYMKYGD